MRHVSSIHLAPTTLVLLWTSLAGQGFKLPSGCTLPFDSIATKPDPYVACGNNGSGVNGAPIPRAKILEDNAKDNLCGDTSDITTVDFSILQKMQEQAPPKGQLATSRNSLHNFFNVDGKKLGEGSIVRL